jgi:hypothetical protein
LRQPFAALLLSGYGQSKPEHRSDTTVTDGTPFRYVERARAVSDLALDRLHFYPILSLSAARAV